MVERSVDTVLMRACIASRSITTGAATATPGSRRATKKMARMSGVTCAPARPFRQSATTRARIAPPSDDGKTTTQRCVRTAHVEAAQPGGARQLERAFVLVGAQRARQRRIF